jgi:SRSO17 transposase
VPGEVTFATKPELARQMLERAFAEEVPRRWVTGDSVCGSSRVLRRWLEEQRQPFVLAVPSNELLWAGPIWEEGHVQTAAEMAGGLPPEAFQRLSAGRGSPEGARRARGWRGPAGRSDLETNRKGGVG